MNSKEMENNELLNKYSDELVLLFKETHWWRTSNSLQNSAKLADKLSELLNDFSDRLLLEDDSFNILDYLIDSEVNDESDNFHSNLTSSCNSSVDNNPSENYGILDSKSDDSFGATFESNENDKSTLNSSNNNNIFSNNSIKASDIMSDDIKLKILSVTSVKYFAHIIKALKVSFSPVLLNDRRMLNFLCLSIIDMTLYINRIINTNPDFDKSILRDIFNLESVPFNFAKKCSFPVNELGKDDERKLSLQAVFLLVLRRSIPFKYKNTKDFLIAYPAFEDRPAQELNKLRICANWFDLVFYTLPSKNNKTFLMSMIPKLCEGSSVKYITGSGETRSTSDRVSIYRTEGNCEKICRPPRKRKAASRTELTTTEYFNNSVLGNDLVYYPFHKPISNPNADIQHAPLSDFIMNSKPMNKKMRIIPATSGITNEDMLQFHQSMYNSMNHHLLSLQSLYQPEMRQPMYLPENYQYGMINAYAPPPAYRPVQPSRQLYGYSNIDRLMVPYCPSDNTLQSNQVKSSLKTKSKLNNCEPTGLSVLGNVCLNLLK